MKQSVTWSFNSSFCAITLVLIFPSMCFALSNRNRLTVDAFFDKPSTDAELAFKYATQWHNIYETEGPTFQANSEVVSNTSIFHIRELVCNATSASSGVLAIFGMQNPIGHLVTQQVCRNHHIPYIQTSWQPPTYEPPLVSLNFFPAADLLAEGLSYVVDHLKWEKYAVVYQNAEALIRLQGILEMVDEGIPVRLLGENNHRSVFKKLKTLGVVNVILDCALTDTVKVLQQAKDVGLLNRSSSVLLTNLDAHTLDFSQANTAAKIYSARLFDPENRYLDYTLQMWTLFEQKSNRHVSTTTRTIQTEAVLMIDAIDFLLKAATDFSKTDKLQTPPMFCDLANIWEDGCEFADYLKDYHLSSPVTGAIRFDKYGRRISFSLELARTGSDETEFTWHAE